MFQYFLGIVLICRKRQENSINTILKQICFRCCQLRVIHLSRCSNEIDDVVMDIIAKASIKLTEFNLSGCYKITESGLLKLLFSQTHIHSLDLTWCSILTDAHLKVLAENLVNLIDLTLSGCKNITDQGMKHLSLNCKKLQQLDISVCGLITTTSIESVLKNCVELQALNLSWCKITDSLLAQISIYATRLHTIKLNNCTDISDQGIENMMQNGGLLEDIDLSFCFKLTDNSIKSIATTNKTRLKVLNISWCQNITDKGVAYLGQSCTHLVRLDVSWCNKLTHLGIQALVSNCQRLKIIDIRYCYLVSCDKLSISSKKTRILMK